MTPEQWHDSEEHRLQLEEQRLLGQLMARLLKDNAACDVDTVLGVIPPE